MPSVFEYTDYREYLKAYFAERKRTDPKFSHRWLARRLELTAPNFILLVMQGKRNLKRDLCLRLSEVLKHNRKEAAYFEELVSFGQAGSDREKQLAWSRMTGLRSHVAVAKIEEDHYEYYSNWYNPVVRELVTDGRLGGDPARLAKAVTPRITAGQAKRSIELLVRLGMISKSGSHYVQASPLVATAPEVTSLAVRNFHRLMGRLAVESLDRIPTAERNITAYTLKLSRTGFEAAKRKLDEVGRELLQMAGTDAGADRAYQVNLQLFPVSSPRAKE